MPPEWYPAAARVVLQENEFAVQRVAAGIGSSVYFFYSCLLNSFMIFSCALVRNPAAPTAAGFDRAIGSDHILQLPIANSHYEWIST